MMNDKELIKLYESIQYIEDNTEDNVISEGIWSKIKYGLSKLGRYKAGGKIFGKSKVDAEYAKKIKTILDKQGNEVIRKLDANIKETNPDFPNSQDPQQFLTTVMEIAAVYDSISAATKKQPNEEGYLPVDMANAVINDLREYVNKFLDVDLLSFYTGVNESENENEDESDDDDYDWGFESPWCPSCKGSGCEECDGSGMKRNSIFKNEEYEITEADPMDAGDVRAGLQAKRGDGEDFASTRADTMKSNKLPMTLAGIGASLGAFSWLANTEWFKSLFDVVTKNPSIEYIKQAVQEKTQVFASIKPNEGMTQIMNRLNGMNLNPNSSPQEFINGVKTLGGGNVQDGIDALTQQGGIFADPEAAKKALTEIVNNPNGHGSNLGQLFQGKLAGTGESFGDSLVTQTGGSLKGMIINTLIKSIPKLVLGVNIVSVLNPAEIVPIPVATNKSPISLAYGSLYNRSPWRLSGSR